MIINEDFKPKQEDKRLPPGQHETQGFPVLSMGPTPEIERAEWSLEIRGLAEHVRWSWEEFMRLNHSEITTDIHCVTRWSKFTTRWTGIFMDEIMRVAKVSPNATHLVAHCYDGYTTNLPLEDVVGGKGMVAFEYEGELLEPRHGGPVRLLVPHLYFWKSAKWLKSLTFLDHDEPGFWETKGYHNYGDPFKEQRYFDD